MVDDQWFETTGKAHLHAFFGEIAHALAIGKARGLRIKEVNADELIRLYRGDNMLVTDEQAERAAANGVNYRALYERVAKRGWSVEQAINTPVQRRRNLSEWISLAEKNGINRNTFYTRIRDGMDPERAATLPVKVRAE